MQPAVLTMGFSPAAAVATWRLAASRQFKCYTYWPVADVAFASETFGSETFASTPFDLQPTSLQLVPQQAFAAVILVVPTIKDVGRMCRRLKPVLSKHTLVLVDVSGGIAPVQRLVRTNLGTAALVCGLICDIEAELSVAGDAWTVTHRAGASKHALALEPPGPAAAQKTIVALEAAWTAAGTPAAHAKSATAFAEQQWQRTIAVVAFEVAALALDVPDPAALAQSLIAKPILEGLISELTAVAAACGVKGLPSRSQFMSRGPTLARRAPVSSAAPGVARIYYDVLRGAPIALDFLVLLPILLSDELPKGGPTPYLESLYAYTSRQIELSTGGYKSLLFQRAGAASTGVTAETEERAREAEARMRDAVAKESEITARETRYGQVLDDLRLQQQQHADNVAQFEKERAQHARHSQSLAELQAREEQLAAAEQQAVARERERERDLRQREHALVSREQVLLQREKEQLARAVTPPDASAQSQYAANQYAGPPTTPGGTVYSRFDPKGPASYDPAPSAQAPGAAGVPNGAPYAPNGAPFAPNGPNGSYGAPNGVYGAPNGGGTYGSPPGGSDMYSRRRGPQQQYERRGSRPLMSPQSSQMPFSPPAPQNGFVSPGPVAPRSRRQSRQTSSAGEDLEGIGMGRRRQSSVNNISSFSQNFQLDSVIGNATDRYHFVSRAKAKQRDHKISSDEEAYQQNRRFLHGGGAPPANYDMSHVSASNISAANMSMNGSASVSGDISRAYGDSSTANVAATGKRHSVGRPMIPSAIVASNSLNDFGGFNFIDAMEGGSNGSAGSHNNSSTGSNITPSRSQSGTPPTPHASAEAHTSKWDPTAVPFNFS